LPYSLDGIHINTPLSQSEIHFHDIFNQLEPDQTVLAGKINGNAKAVNNSKQIKIIDYYERGFNYFKRASYGGRRAEHSDAGNAGHDFKQPRFNFRLRQNRQTARA
jgi:hypothetical protein